MIKSLMKCVGEYKKDSLLAPAYVSLEVVMEVLIPLLMANLIDFGIDKGDMGHIIKTGLLLAAAAGLSLFFGVAAGFKAASASAGFANNLRRRMFSRVQTFSFSNIDRFSTASIVTRLTTDVQNVQNAYQMVVRIAVRAPFMLIFSLVFSFRIDGKLSLIFLACVPVLGLGLWLVMSRAHPVFERVFRTYDKLNNVVQENLRGIRVVKSFVREEREIEKFGAISQEIYKDFSKAEKTVAFNAPLMQFCMYASMLLVSWFGARAIVACGGDPAVGLSTGELMSLMTYAIQILSSLMMVSMIMVMLTISRASMERIAELLNEESDLASKENAVTDVKDGSVRFENVTFRYHKNAGDPCLDCINLQIESGQTVGILGGTGSSKTSLVQLIPRLYDVSEGSVKVGGVDVRDYDLEALRNAVAVVLQKNELFSGSIKENLRWGDENASDGELEHACKLAQADGFIRALPNGYDAQLEQSGTNVSGGQKQRLCIARALLKKPKILILDDSTSAVDTKTDALIRRALRQELPNTTKLIIAQRVSSVQDADLILVMEQGRIIASGTHEALLESSPVYREVYQSQQKGGVQDE